MKLTIAVLIFLLTSCKFTQKAPESIPQAPKRVGPHRIVRPPAKTLTIAVIDTGFGYQGKGDATHLCKFGHKNFSKDTEMANGIPVDHHGHGTNIAGIIDRFAVNGRPYCIVIIKYYDPKFIKDDNLEHEIDALQYAININADVINFSGGGTGENAKEKKLVRAYLDKGGIFFAAAGNEHADISKQPYYPAMSDPRVISVGNVNRQGKIVASSNFGAKVSCFEMGENVIGNDIVMTGTSQATAVATGKFIAGKPCGTK